MFSICFSERMVLVSIFKGAILGLFQGLAEFLPISSSGHLNLMQALFGLNLDHQLLFNILLHVGTLIAVMVVFWKDWIDMLLHPIKNRTLLLLFIASLPALFAKLLFDKQLDYLETSISLLGVFFLITGLMLILTQIISRRNQQKGVEKDKVGFLEALVMGCLQAVGMLPGISRSGSTIFGGVSSRLSRESAAKFSFMMSAPAIVGSLLVEGKDALESGITLGNDLPAIIVGMVVAAISGYLAIRFFLKLISKVSLNWFALYVTLLGLLVIILQLTGVLSAQPAAPAAVASLASVFPC
ncbi:MAG: undecaprenyl-diphosphate phosphatase [Clostridiales bacterium]|nr:undecaprenyl-diphosphate phosphatase [Clostridiales bacterium]